VLTAVVVAAAEALVVVEEETMYAERGERGQK